MVLRKKKIKITEYVRSLSQRCLLGCLWDRQHAPEAMWYLPELPALLPPRWAAAGGGVVFWVVLERERPQLGEMEQGSRCVNHKGQGKGI